MSSDRDAAARPRSLLARTFGLRIALWYAALFILGAVAIVCLTYFLTASSLEERDRQLIDAKLGQYATEYARGGMAQLLDTVQAEQRTAPERLFVRVVDRDTESVLLSTPDGWDPAEIESASLRLSDGTLVQVGKSTEERIGLLAQFRRILGLVTFSIAAVALSGGWLMTRSAAAPIRQLTQAFRRIVATGRTDERVALAGSPHRPGRDDAIDELARLFNAMLDRIEALVNGMRDALDNVSHDLRTPLTRLRGAAELALAGPADLERAREALADCVEESDRVLVMLNTLMDISEAESGAMKLRLERVALAEVVARAADLYREVAEAKGVALEVVPESGAGAGGGPADEVVVLADRARLERVAANLVDNAVKYTPAGGRVEVAVARAAPWAVLSVRDTGKGIPADELPRVFDRLFRGDASRSERGLGLGLSLVRAIVEAHGGKVEVASEPGRGSTFTVRLAPAGVEISPM
jgi:signal transduction histidine kinase